MPPKTKLVQIFKAGTHKSMKGIVANYSAQDLKMMAGVYDPNIKSAPVVIDHPANDEPAYGKVLALFVKDDGLYAQTVIDAALETLVKLGRIKGVSASFSMPFSEDNPMPGAYYLKHVGFLASMRPAVKGMAPLAFAERNDALCFAEGIDCAVSFASPSAALIQGQGHERWPLHQTALEYQRICPALTYAEAVNHASIVF